MASSLIEAGEMESRTIVALQSREPVATYWHSLGFLGIVTLTTVAGFAAQRRPTSGGGLTSAHDGMIPVYFAAIALDWLLVYFVWGGVRKRGGRLLDLVGGRWKNARDVLSDLAIAAPFWVIWMAVGRGLDYLLGPGAQKTIDILLPRSALEAAVWIGASATAGFCEELVFRGYVQQQLQALSGSSVIAVIGQGALFGLMHAYQGWRPVIVISALGMLFGCMALWRGSLRAGMLAHAWADVWSGWLSHL